jgi:protease-4
MTLDSDNLLDRIKLKKTIYLWRNLAILAFTAFLAVLLFKAVAEVDATGEHIARVSIDGVIFEDNNRNKVLKKLKDNKNVKAVVVYIDSPGGTIVGGEDLYNYITQIGKVKPVVAVMGSMATSGGYMAAIATDRIFARSGTITGSVGVLMQSFDVTELGKKMGVTFQTYKSGKLKAVPSPLERTEPEAVKMLNESISDSFAMFLDMVVKRRALGAEEITKISDGRFLTGRQALQLNLIDEIGGEDEAVKWLQEQRKIDKNLKVIDVELDTEKKFIDKLVSKVSDTITPVAGIKNGGLLAISSF